MPVGMQNYQRTPTAYFGLIVDYSGPFSEITDVSLNGFPCSAASK